MHAHSFLDGGGGGIGTAATAITHSGAAVLTIDADAGAGTAGTLSILGAGTGNVAMVPLNQRYFLGQSRSSNEERRKH